MKKELIPLATLLFLEWLIIVFFVINMIVKQDYFNFDRNSILILNIISLFFVIRLIELKKKTLNKI